MLKIANIYIIYFGRLFLTICNIFSLFSFVSFCFIAKQRIDSGFFLFEAERKKKEIKKKNKKILKKCREAMESSDDDFS